MVFKAVDGVSWSGVVKVMKHEDGDGPRYFLFAPDNFSRRWTSNTYYQLL